MDMTPVSLVLRLERASDSLPKRLANTQQKEVTVPKTGSSEAL